jgi:LPS-assembly lipoprotein
MQRVGLAACGLLLLTSCGFHLRGAGVESTVESAYVRADRSVAITDELTRVLRQSGVEILDNPEHAAVVIDLLEQQQNDRTVSYTERATTAEIQLEQGVRFQVDGPDEVTVVPERWARATRTYLVDTRNLVGSNQQQRLLRSELVTDLVQQIMRSLATATRTKAP